MVFLWFYQPHIDVREVRSHKRWLWASKVTLRVVAGRNLPFEVTKNMGTLEKTWGNTRKIGEISGNSSVFFGFS
jgi:hypothetical protein